MVHSVRRSLLLGIFRNPHLYKKCYKILNRFLAPVIIHILLCMPSFLSKKFLSFIRFYLKNMFCYSARCLIFGQISGIRPNIRYSLRTDIQSIWFNPNSDPFGCAESEFMCENNVCIDETRVCDGLTDCRYTHVTDTGGDDLDTILVKE